jgi:hypothetical protein
MSFAGQLMEQAREIQQLAIAKSMEHHGVRPATRPGDPPLAPTYGEDQKRQQIQRSFAGIPGLFEPFTEMPDPASFDAMISELWRALGVLSSGQDLKDPINGTIYPVNPALDKLSGAESYVEGWTGRAAMNFKSNFIDPFPSIVRNQFILAAVLKSALEAEQEIWSHTRNDIDKIARDAITALEHMDDCGRNDWTMTFTVVASVAAVAAVPLSGGTSLMLEAVAVTAVGAASQVVAAWPRNDPPQTMFSGETAEAILAEVREEISTVLAGIQGQESEIADAVARTRDLVTRNRDLFVSARPALAGAAASTVTGPEYMGYAL